jgi:hypothetical protein
LQFKRSLDIIPRVRGGYLDPHFPARACIQSAPVDLVQVHDQHGGGFTVDPIRSDGTPEEADG